MIDPQAEAIKRLMSLAKSGAQRTPLVPRVTQDIANPDVGLLWIRDDEKKAYLKIDEDTTLMVASATPTSGGEIVAERSLPGSTLQLNTVTSDELASDSVTELELAPGAVGNDSFAALIDAVTSVKFYASNPVRPALTLDADFDHATDIFRVLRDGVQRFRVDATHTSIGEDLPQSAFSVQTTSTDYAMRVRGAGGGILIEKTNGQRLMSLDAGGNLVINGAVSSLSGNSDTAGSMSINGALTVTNQTNLLSGLSVAGRVDFTGAEVDIDGQVVFNAEPTFPASYSAKIGQAVHLRTITASEDRMILEGVSNVNRAELQLGTGGPVLSGSLTQPDRMFIGSSRIVTSAVDGILGNQIAKDTLTGGNGPGVGNIGAETITGYNVKNGSITSTELSPGAVVRAAIDTGAVGPVQLADGSVIDRVVASMGVGKLISGTLNADEIFMGPSGHIYLGPTFLSEINDERVQIDSSGIRAYNSFNTPLAEFTPGGFTLRTGVDGARLEFDATTGIELFGTAGERNGYLSPLGQFQLDSAIDGARMSLTSNEGVQFYAGATKNLAFNPGFIGGSQHELPVAAEALDDQRHVFAGEFAVKFRSTNKNVSAPSYVDVPFKNTIGTGTSVTRTQKNWCPNPSATTATTGWLVNTGTGLTSGSGQALGFINDTAVWQNASAAAVGAVITPTASTAEGVQWALSCSARVSTSMNVVVVIEWFNINSVLVVSTTSEPFALKGNVVTQIGLVATAPALSASFRIRVRATMAATDRLEVSNALYEQTSGIGPYFDGYVPGYQWDGTPGTSTSSLTPVPVQDSPNNLLSIFVWSDVPAWTQIEGRDSTAGVGRGLSTAQRLTPNQWSRVSVQCVGRMDKVRLFYPSTDPARQNRIVTTPVWWSGVQVEADKDLATPFCSGGEPGCRWEGLEAKSASIRDRDVVVTQISPTLGTSVSGAIVGGSLTSASFFAGRIFGTYINGGTIEGNIIRGNQISGDQILAGTIQGTSISARTIDAGSLKAFSITGTEIAGTTITGTNIVAGTLTATQIAARAITADKLQADLVLSSRIIAGAAATGARVEMMANTGLQAFTSSGMRTFFLNSSTGEAFFRGEISTAESGSRIELNTGSVNPDTIRFYQGNNFAIINAEPAPNNTAAIIARSQTFNNVRGGFGCYPTEAFLSVDSSVQMSAISVLQNELNIWSRNQISFFHRNSSGNVIGPSRINLIRAGGGEATLSAPSNNSSIVFGPSYIFCGDNAFNGVDLIAKNVLASSSETIKDEISDDFGFEASNLLRRVKAKKFKLKSETDPKRPTKTKIRDRRPKKNPDGSDFKDSSGATVFEEIVQDVDIPLPPARNHYGLIAEELRAVVPGLVEVDSRLPGGLLIRHGDLIGVLWKFANESLAVIDDLLHRVEVLERGPLGLKK